MSTISRNQRRRQRQRQARREQQPVRLPARLRRLGVDNTVFSGTAVWTVTNEGAYQGCPRCYVHMDVRGVDFGPSLPYRHTLGSVQSVDRLRQVYDSFTVVRCRCRYVPLVPVGYAALNALCFGGEYTAEMTNISMSQALGHRHVVSASGSTPIELTIRPCDTQAGWSSMDECLGSFALLTTYNAGAADAVIGYLTAQFTVAFAGLSGS